MDAKALTTEGIWRDLQADLQRFIGRRVSDAHLAEDLLQDVFIRIHTHLNAVEDADRLSAWVYRIARNAIIDHYRAKASIANSLAEDVPCHDDSGDLDPRSLMWLRSMVEQLPETYREAVHLAELDGLPQQDVADRLGLSLTAAKSRIRRGRALLKSMLLDCCDFEVDRRGNVIEYQQKGRCSVSDPHGAECGCSKSNWQQ